MARRHRPGSGSGSSDTLWRIHQIGGADLALRYAQLRDEARARAEREATPPAEPPPPAPATLPTPAVPNDIAGLFDVLRQQFEHAKPALEPDRSAGLTDFMGRLGGLVDASRSGSGARSLADILGDRSKIDGLMAEFLPRVAQPTLRGPGAKPGTAAARLMTDLQALKLYAGQSGTQRNAGAGAMAAAMDLFARIARLTTRLNEAGDDSDALLRIERDEARGLAAEVFAFARRRHLLLAQPVWGSSNMARHANNIFFSGPDSSYRALDGMVWSRALKLAKADPNGADFATQRWRDLSAANVAVFDLTDLHPQVFYELGMALASGIQLVLIAPEATELPFDIAQNVARYDRPAALKNLLRDEIDAAMYRLQASDNQSSLPATLAAAGSLLAQGENLFARHALAAMRQAGDNAAHFLAAVQAFNGALGANAHEILHTRWPGSYPDAMPRRWFAVMPFRPGANRAHEGLQRMLARLDPLLLPIRGDEAEGQQIMHSIWDEICRARLVSVDLTELNPNVCLELGIAHTLGRPTVLMAERGTERLLKALLPGVAKWRCHSYDNDDPSASASLKTALIAALREAA
jgi:hypothetical protein